jgi:hypothetical protein
VALVAVLYVWRDIAPIGSLYAGTLDGDKVDKLTQIALLASVAVVLLISINTSLYRLLEGYAGPLNLRWLQGKRKAELVRRQKAVKERREKNMATSDPMETFAIYRELQDLLESFPPDQARVLPTRFGNVIRAFEVYPSTVHGIDAPVGWYRLQAVIPKTYLAMIDDARAKVDLWVNVFALSLVVLLASAAQCVWTMWHTGLPDLKCSSLAIALVCVVIAIVAYRAATALAIEWGHFVKSAFDLYLPTLAQQLGYKLPDTLKKRTDFWDAANSQFLYWAPIDPAMWPPAPTLAKAPDGGGNGGGDSGTEADA